VYKLLLELYNTTMVQSTRKEMKLRVAMYLRASSLTQEGVRAYI
jgi:hypothetical protein